MNLELSESAILPTRLQAADERIAAFSDAVAGTLVAAVSRIPAMDRFYAVAGRLGLDYDLDRKLALDRVHLYQVKTKLERCIGMDMLGDLAVTLALVRDLAEMRRVTLTIARRLASPRVAYLDLRIARARHDPSGAGLAARNLADDLDDAHQLAKRLARAYASNIAVARDFARARAGAQPRAVPVGTQPMPANAQGREKFPLVMLVLAVRVLPVTHRNRYREEFLAELVDHPSWPARMTYAMRVTVQVWSLRFSLFRAPEAGARWPRWRGGHR
jgi:hypothetical protein